MVYMMLKTGINITMLFMCTADGIFTHVAADPDTLVAFCYDICLEQHPYTGENGSVYLLVVVQII